MATHEVQGVTFFGWQPWRTYCQCGNRRSDETSKSRLCDTCKAEGHYDN